MDDPKVAKRLEDAITMVGTCMDMCPRHERLTRDMEGLLDDLEAWFEPVRCTPGPTASIIQKPR